MNDIMLAMDSKCVTLLVLLDMTVQRLTLSTMRSLFKIGCKTKLGYRGGSELVQIVSV